MASIAGRNMGIDEPLMTAAAEAVHRGGSLEDLARPFLELLHRITGLESSYLTEVRWEQGLQEILLSSNQGTLQIPEGLVVPWQDTLCRRALEEGRPCTSNVPELWGDSVAAAELGITTYVSVPVTDRADAVIGTLCAASSSSRELSREVMAVMTMFARLISDQWQRDLAHRAAIDRANAAEARLRERAMLLAEAEHKLKSPLTLLRGWIDLLSDGWRDFDDAARESAFGTLREATTQACTQVEEMLDEARSEVLVSQMSIVAIDAQRMLERVAREARGATSSHRIDLDVAALEVVDRSGPPLAVRADDQALWQVLWHLTENAMKYSPGGGTITLAGRPEGDTVVLEVRDEGLGVPEDLELFAPFSRSVDPAFAGIPGSGLGLHIVKNLVRSMEGTVSARRREEKGSVFAVVLPRAK